MRESMIGKEQAARQVGQSAAAGFQIGVRRTYPVSRGQAWALLTSPEGMKLWLGELPSLEFVPGTEYISKEGNYGEIRVVKPLEQIRMTWQRKHWAKPSTVQIRLLETKSGNTTISLHQEKLEDMQAREQMKQYWEEAQAGFQEHFDADR